MHRYYLSSNGNILNTELRCFQTPTGNFLRRVFDSEMDYLIEVLPPVEFPEGLPEPELPIWVYLWETKEIEGEEVYDVIAFTREVNGKREYAILYVSNEDIHSIDVRIVDVDMIIYMKDENNSDGEAELLSYARKASLEEVWNLGNPDFKGRVKKYKILKSLGIKPPYKEKIERRRRRKVKVAHHKTV